MRNSPACRNRISTAPLSQQTSHRRLAYVPFLFLPFFRKFLSHRACEFLFPACLNYDGVIVSASGSAFPQPNSSSSWPEVSDQDTRIAPKNLLLCLSHTRTEPCLGISLLYEQLELQPGLRRRVFDILKRRKDLQDRLNQSQRLPSIFVNTIAAGATWKTLSTL
jgi:hypothetical protein